MPKSIAEVEYLTLAEAAKRMPGRAHLNTVRRWCDRGYNGIVLASWRCANKRLTTIEAIDTFVAATTAQQAPKSTPAAPSTAHQLAEAKLDAMGVR